MQHRYVPDLGDFSKFAVIDALSNQGTLRTALIWYLVDPREVGDHHNNDGRHTAYLEGDRARIADCHPELYRRFQVIHATGEKHVGVYDKHGVLPNVCYFAEPISYADVPAKQRAAYRAGWLGRALRAAQDADLVVLDPDNGLMADRVSPNAKQAVKYAALDECAAFYGEGERTLVVYQHAHRQGSAQTQADHGLNRISDRLGVDRGDCFALRFHRGTTRFYLVAPARGRAEPMRAQARAMLDSAWGRRGHFSLID
ncbi:MAG: hypothetical protein ACE37H_06730 [Phycisphaeraceae bacterium]